MNIQKNRMNPNTYRLAKDLTDFQRALYTHLVNWKREYLTEEAGTYKGQEYDTILPDKFKRDIAHNLREGHYPIYPKIVERLLSHKERFPFKFHLFFSHMTSSQMACFNLFIPLFNDSDIAAEILRAVKPDLKSIATEYFDSGFRVEFWDGHGKERGLLGDHSLAAGTDSDIAIAYYDVNDRLNLWLIEHKLSERDFSPCKAHNSQGRTAQHDCNSTEKILKHPELCYYDSGRGYNYWKITRQHPEFFLMEELLKYPACPFINGLNQLWRNQLLGLAIEQAHLENLPFHKVYFSVVSHPKNDKIKKSIEEYQKLIKKNERFSSFTSDCIINTATEIHSPFIQTWAEWYKKLYYY